MTSPTHPTTHADIQGGVNSNASLELTPHATRSFLDSYTTMLSPITIERLPKKDAFHRERWVLQFDIHRRRWVLRMYVAEERPSKRHTFRTTASWDRLSARTSEASKPLIPRDVAEAVRTRFMAQVSIEGEEPIAQAALLPAACT